MRDPTGWGDPRADTAVHDEQLQGVARLVVSHATLYVRVTTLPWPLDVVRSIVSFGDVEARDDVGCEGAATAVLMTADAPEHV